VDGDAAGGVDGRRDRRTGGQSSPSDPPTLRLALSAH
jgi:hypothetical protein